MSKTVKRKLTIIVSVVLVLSLIGGSCVFADDMNVNLDIDTLISTGWTVEEIEDLFPDELITNAKRRIPVGSMTEKYYRVGEDVEELSKEDCYKQVSAVKEIEAINTLFSKSKVMRSSIPDYGTISDEELVSNNYLKLKLQVYYDPDGYYHYLITTTFEWLTDPSQLYRLYDILNVSTNTYLTLVPSTKYAYYKALVTTYFGGYYNSSFTYQTTNPDIAWETSADGIAYGFDLVNNTYDDSGVSNIATNHRGLFYCYANANYAPGSQTAGVYFRYYQERIALTPSISLISGDVSISPSYAYTHLGPNPALTFGIN